MPASALLESEKRYEGFQSRNRGRVGETGHQIAEAVRRASRLQTSVKKDLAGGPDDSRIEGRRLGPARNAHKAHAGSSVFGDVISSVRASGAETRRHSRLPST